MTVEPNADWDFVRQFFEEHRSDVVDWDNLPAAAHGPVVPHLANIDVWELVDQLLDTVIAERSAPPTIEAAENWLNEFRENHAAKEVDDACSQAVTKWATVGELANRVIHQGWFAHIFADTPNVDHPVPDLLNAVNFDSVGSYFANFFDHSDAVL